MSDHALRNYRQSREQRLGRNDARRIRSERDKARSPTSGAPQRWPFELLQNAHDPGPREGSTSINVDIRARGSLLVFRHNGRPFTIDDLTALLSGGSNKDYDSEETTGRYGTGFLVTHVLSQLISLGGLFLDGISLEQFEIHLDRSGDENAILLNAKDAERSIEAAKPVQSLSANLASAEFRYPVDNLLAMRSGMEALHQSIPYLFGTCPHFEHFSITTEDAGSFHWHADVATSYQSDEVMIRTRTVRLTTDGHTETYRILRLTPSAKEYVGLLILLRAWPDNDEFVTPPSALPRIFARMPIRLSAFLSFNYVIDAPFNVQEERDRIAMDDGDKEQLAAALRLIPTAVTMGAREGWKNGHRLAKLARVETAFSERTQVGELDWWNSQLQEIAREVAGLPLVQTVRGLLPASGGDWNADFILPRYSSNTSVDQLPEARVWKLASETSILAPPIEAYCAEWNELSAGWESLDVDVDRRGLREISGMTSDGIEQLNDLPLTVPPRVWLADFFDLLGELPDTFDCTDIANGLLPNQQGRLCSAAELKRDAGISEGLKDIAASIGCAVREKLLDNELGALAMGNRHVSVGNFLRKVLPTELTEQEVLDACLLRLSNTLPDGRTAADSELALIRASIRLLQFLWTSRGPSGATLAQRCPLLARDGSITLYTAKKIMAPVVAWHEEARPFASIYPPSRVLADLYAGNDQDPSIVSPLAAWGIAFHDPVFYGKRGEIDEALLRTLVYGDQDVTGMTVKDESFSQVALLGTEVIQRCEEDPQLAATLLGFVLKYLAPNDLSWRQHRTLLVKRSGADVQITVRNALWVAELKRRAWVPIQGDEGNEKVVASPATLSVLLRDDWLVGNDSAVDFLIDCFGFDVLSLRLQTLPEQLKGQVAARLAELIHLGGQNTAFYDQLLSAVKSQRLREREKERNRQFGLAVQNAIQAYLDQLGLSVKVIDCGYDFDVQVPDGLSSPDEGTHELSVGQYFVEVKATTAGYVRLSPAQARVASTDDRFILCVVDLRGCSSERVTEAWTAKDVEPITTIISDIRHKVHETHSLVEAATEQLIPINNERQLRYVVPPQLWESGTTIRTWVKTIAPRVQASSKEVHVQP